MLLLSALVLLVPGPNTAYTQETSLTFPETGKTVRGRFLQYWQEHGGLAQQGYPISDEMQEKSDLDGKTYTVQYFERAVFELHPENQPPYDVLLSLLGIFEYKRYYGFIGPSKQRASTENPRLFTETGKAIGGRFRTYWEQNGGLAQQGYSITDEFEEKSRLNGKIYMVQYFERAVFEMHTENQPPYDVLLSQLGTFRYQHKTYIQAPRDCASVYTRNGTVIGEGTNTVPSQLYELKSYRVEEVVLPGRITCEVNAPVPGSNSQFQFQTLTFDKVWRFAITSEHKHHVTVSPFWIYLDNTVIGVAGTSADGYQLVTIIYDRALLKEGAIIGISYAIRGDPDVILPEKLHFNRLP